LSILVSFRKRTFIFGKWRKLEAAHPGPILEGVGASEPAKAGTPNVCSPGFSRFVWRFASNLTLDELPLRRIRPPLLMPTLVVDRSRVKINRAIAQFRCANEVGLVGFGAAAACGLIDFAADVGPVGFNVAMSVEHGEH
jgi:hypothetical protein